MSSYDQNLLDEVPKATRAQLQAGYNVDLLEQPPRRTPSVRNPPPQIPQPALVAVPSAAETGSGEKFGSPANVPAKSRASFWRTRNGIITIAVLVLVVIGAVVGGAVGGTVHKSGNNDVSTTGNSTTNGPIAASTPEASSALATATSMDSQGIGGGTRPGGFTVPSTSTASTTQSGETAGIGKTTAVV